MGHFRVRALSVFCIGLVAVSMVSGCGGGSVTETAPTVPGSPTAPPPSSAAPPVVTSVTPASVLAGSAAFSLQINGTGFVTASVASWNGAALVTTYVSATSLQAAVPASLAGSGGTFAILVANPDGQKSAGSPSNVAVDNPVPGITSLSPSQTTAASGAADVVITGSGFEPGTVASFGGKPRVTNLQSGTQLTMALTAADFATSGQVNVTVANPAPGGGVSPPAIFNVDPLPPAPPVITGTDPASLLAGSPASTVTIIGTGFLPDARVTVNGMSQVPASVTATSMQITIPAHGPGLTGLIPLQVVEGAGVSNFFNLPLVNPVPAIQSISPTTVTAGSPGLTLAMQATGLISGTQVTVNGVAYTNFSANQMGLVEVDVPASALAQVGTVSISLTNPAPGGGTSNTVTINVVAGSTYLRSVSLPANALTWNPQENVIYAAIPASAGSYANSVVAIDPATAKIARAQTMQGEPSLLAISGDQQYLYVAMSGIATIARLKLPGLTLDIQWKVGPAPGVTAISDMHVAPGSPHTIAVAQEAGAQGGSEIAIYDDAVMRPQTAGGGIAPIGYVNVFQWGADATTIYATESTESGGPEFLYSVNAQGATLLNTDGGVFSNFQKLLAYDGDGGRLYDPAGDVVDAPTGRSLGSFPNGGITFAVDSSQRRVYFLGTTLYPDGGNYPSDSPVPQISVYDEDHFGSQGSVALPAVAGTISVYGGAYLVRWGTAGLAFNTGSSIYILDGPFVTPGAVASSSVGTFAAAPPQLSAMSLESVVAGSPDVTIQLTGHNFTQSTIVTWNNNILAATVLSDTEVQVTIPAAALTKPAAALMYAANSLGEGISNALAFSVLPDLGTGMQLTALNLSGTDLAWNAATNHLYVAVSDTDSLYPQSIATVDPAAGKILSTLPVAANPFVLSIAGDDHYLYAGFQNYANVQRYALPGLTPDLLIPLGIDDGYLGWSPGSVESCDFAVSMMVAPGLDTTIAVTQGNAALEPVGCGSAVVIDGATQRPVSLSTRANNVFYDFSKLTWGADATAIYAQGDICCTFQPISSLSVSASGLVFDQVSRTDDYLGYRPHFDVGTGLIYSDGGAVTQPSNLAQVGNFNASGLMVPDSALGVAYFLGQSSAQTGRQAGVSFTLQIFDLKTYALLDSIVIPDVIGYPNQLVRWGISGMAFTTGDYEGDRAQGMLYILSGPKIARTTPSVQPPPADTDRVQFTWSAHLRKRPANTVLVGR